MKGVFCCAACGGPPAIVLPGLGDLAWLLVLCGPCARLVVQGDLDDAPSARP